MTRVLDSISEKLAKGQPLQVADAEALWETKDLVSLGMLGDEARRRRHGDVATYLRVADVDLAAGRIGDLPAHAGEIRVLGDVTQLAAHVEDVRELVVRAGSVAVSAGVLGETGVVPSALTAAFRALRAAGVYALAELQVDQVGDPESVVKAALDEGLVVARFTVHRASPSGRWEAFERVKRIQSATGGVRTFAPLPRVQAAGEPTTGYQDVKTVALARLVLDRVSSIQVDWAQYGPKLAQVALLFGADDIDAVSAFDDVSAGKRRAPLEEIRRNIRAASLTPVERDARFARRDE